MPKKSSVEQKKERISQIDKQVEALCSERTKILESIQRSGHTRYFYGVPHKPGVYHYSSESAAATGGGALGYWDGRGWKKYKDWGDFTNRGVVVWYGEGRDRKQPITNESFKNPK